jgi:D-3-phosphoglycerate dehydrogenase
MQKPVVLLYEPIHARALEQLKQHAEVRTADNLEESYLLQVVGDVEGIIIRANGKVSRQIMQAAPRLKVVARHGTGVEAIDLEAAAELGITVVNTPDANVESVAEQCLAMMIILAKHIREADQAIRAGDWAARYRLIGVELLGKTIGIIGIGRIGYRLAELCYTSFSMPIVYFDIVANLKAEKNLNAKRVELDELLKKGDFISIHLPLIPSTKGLINAEVLRKMKPSAFLINSSRGPVIDQADLIQALQNHWIAGAGLDVFDPEPLPSDSTLLELENVILSPHMAAHTNEALYRMAMVVEDVLAVIEGRAPKHPVIIN